MFLLKGGERLSVKAPGLPNIVGTVGGITLVTGDSEATGAFEAQLIDNAGAANNTHREMINFDASRCSSVYGNSNTVQQPALVLIPQIKF